MQARDAVLYLVAAGVFGALAGCSATASKSVIPTAGIRTALDQAGYRHVWISQDSENKVVTLGGHVTTESHKVQAEHIVASIIVGQLLMNQIAVLPFGAGSDDKTVISDLDKGIENHLIAALTKRNLHKAVNYTVKDRVVTLTGQVDSQATRTLAAQIASSVLDVEQVANELQVRKQKATSTN